MWAGRAARISWWVLTTQPRPRLPAITFESVDIGAWTDPGPFDVILDPVGGSYAALDLKLLALDGRWVLIGLMGGREAKLDLAQVLSKRVQLLGSTLRSRDDQFKADLLSDLNQQVWPLFSEGRLSPQLARAYPMEEAEFLRWLKEHAFR
mgnify:CR=1 FL=1